MIHLIAHILHSIIPVAHAADSTDAAATTSASPIALFGLDWKLFLAQLFNFVVVLFILWRWVFTPLSKKLSERTDKIERSLQQAKEIESNLKDSEAQRSQTLAEARDQATVMIANAQKAAVEVKEQIMAEAKKSGEKLIEQAKAEIENQKAKTMTEIREEAANLVVMATERIIRQKLDPAKDKELIKESLKQI